LPRFVVSAMKGAF